MFETFTIAFLNVYLCLFAGALDGENPSAEAEAGNKIEVPIEDDMEISDAEESDGNPPLPPMPPPDDKPTFKEQAWLNGEFYHTCCVKV